jgi:hypothetical protein
VFQVEWAQRPTPAALANVLGALDDKLDLAGVYNFAPAGMPRFLLRSAICCDDRQAWWAAEQVAGGSWVLSGPTSGCWLGSWAGAWSVLAKQGIRPIMLFYEAAA